MTNGSGQGVCFPIVSCWRRTIMVLGKEVQERGEFGENSDS